MKLTLVICLLAILSHRAVGQRITLWGKIINAPEAGIRVCIPIDPISGKDSCYIVKLNKGTFHFSFPADRPQQVQLALGDLYTDAMVSPGDSLFFKVDAQDPDKLNVLEGKGANLVNLLTDLENEKGRLTGDQFYPEAEKSVKQHYADKELSISEYRLATKFLRYASLRDALKASLAAIPANGIGAIDTMAFVADDSMIYIAAYREFVQYMMTSILKDGPQDVDAYRRHLHKTGKYPPFTRGLACAAIVRYFLQSPYYTGDVEQLFADYLNAVPSDRGFADAALAALNFPKAGSAPPGFKLVSIEGDTLSLSQLKGKPVLIDFWASWCKPCMAQLPYSKKLHEVYGNEVSFVYISLDSKPESWKSAVNTNEIKGTHLLLSSGGQEIKDAYHLTSIPRYVLLDKNGRVISGNAPAPENQELEKLIKEALR